MECSLCGKEIPHRGTWTKGNNAEPLNPGRCCDNCDNSLVIPARLRRMGFHNIADVWPKLAKELDRVQPELMKELSKIEGGNNA